MINNISNNNISFGSQKLLPVKLIKEVANKQTESIAAHFSLLDKNDEKTLKQALVNWNATRYGEYIINRFLKQRHLNPDYRYFMIEEAGKNGKNKIRALAEVRITDHYINLEYLQSGNKLDSERAKKIKGGGSMIIYGLIKLMEDLNKKAIFLTPSTSAFKFYKKLGFEQYSSSRLILERDKAQRVAKKHITPKFHLNA